MNPHCLGLLLLIWAIVIEAFGQVFLKTSALQDNKVRKYLWILLGVSCLGVELIIWTSVLHLLDVSVAFPMGSLTFVVVAFLCWIMLGERITRSRWLGIILILCGTAMVGA